jgi:hypothetical protein
MSPIRYTLVTDGPGDRCLHRIINWVLERIPDVAAVGFVDQYADVREFEERHHGLREKVELASKLFPCDVLFVHRDAETASRETRVDEITQAVAELAELTHVPVVPVRMTEAWLLIDERAIRQAAGNPNGHVDLKMPPLDRLESLPDPKKELRQRLLEASELGGRRRERLKRDLPGRVQRVADLMTDFGPLHGLSAFRAFESDTKRAVAEITRS